MGTHATIGNEVHVPTHFYKVVYDPVNQDAIAFLVPHRKISKSDLPAFIVGVDEVERRSGFDFNNLLDDLMEDDIEDGSDDDPNPATGGDMILAPRKIVTFKCAGKLREKVNDG